MKAKRKTAKNNRGKWSSDPWMWIRLIELLDKMTTKERDRCIRLTVDFWSGK